MGAGLEIPIAESVRRTDSMTSRERLEAVLAGRTPDRVPVKLCAYPLTRRDARLQGDANHQRLAQLAARYTDFLPLWFRYDRHLPHLQRGRGHGPAPLYAESPDAQVEIRRSADGGEILTELTTRAGTLTQVERVDPSQPTNLWVAKPFIQDEAELEVFLAHTWEGLRPDLSGFWRAVERLGDRGLMGIVVVDPVGMASALVDRETYYTWMVTQPELLDWLHAEMFARAGPVHLFRRVRRALSGHVWRR